jgi:putative drug exporter of the RND superfamily
MTISPKLLILASASVINENVKKPTFRWEELPVNKWMAWTARMRWAILAMWIALAAISVFVLPDLQSIISKTEQKFLPGDAESVQARRLLESINSTSKSQSNAVIVLSRDQGLQAADKAWMNQLLRGLHANKEQLGIVDVLSAESQPQLAERFISKDKSTMLAVINLPKADFENDTKQTLDRLKTEINHNPQGTQVALTGSAPISQDFQQSSQDGLRRTEMLTVGLVLIILLFVFRSVVASLIPLITIGISLIISRGLIAAATDYGLPVSNFTESFLIAVLFGAGTDYCILLIQRYREELLSRGSGDRAVAMLRTMRGVGKTIIFSASTVFAAFFLIGFAQFGLYRSAAGVAIGVLVTLVAAMSLAPALLLLFGKAAFWPMRLDGSKGHRESKIWGASAGLASKRSVLVLLAAVILLTPLTLLFQGKRSFDDIAEIDPELGSVVGFRQVEKAFGSGEVFPVTIAVTSSESLRTPSALAALEQASSDTARVPGVQEVRSAVRPLGKQLTELTIGSQLGHTTGALGQLKDGVGTVENGLNDAEKELASGQSQVSKLADGLSKMAGSMRDMRSGMGRMTGALGQSRDGAARISSGLQDSSKASASMKSDINALLQAHPELQEDPHMQAIMARQQALTEGLKSLAVGAAPLSQGLAALVPVARQMESGLGRLVTGQLQAAGGVTSIYDGFSKLTVGLRQGAAGLNQVKGGLDQVQSAQEGIANNSKSQHSGWVVPEEALASDAMKQALDFYISPDGKTTKFDIILKSNPYSGEAMDTVSAVTAKMRESLNASTIADPHAFAAGTSANYNELRDISFNDFVRTGLLVLAGIAIVLMLLLRSIAAPLYVLISLGFNYLITMGIMEFLFVKVFGFPGLSWTVSFFIFLIIVALGVDYSIFLMARFKEEYVPGEVVAAMTKAMRTTGGVIVSAAVIMGGTFGALGFSGVGTLVQIGVGTLIGLLIYATLFMTLIVPSFTFLFGEGNWWPFRPKERETTAKEALLDKTITE